MPRFYDIYMENLDPLKAMTVFMALLFVTIVVSQGYGYMHDPDDNLKYMLTILPIWMWTGLFSIFTISRIINIWKGCTWFASMITSVLGIWLWSVVLVSSVAITLADGADLMFLIPLITELWIMSRTIEKRRA